ncbi:MAG TPA: hypothetical protein VFQ59_03625 [Candidatus Paceibacterota bacterium]|nr:hypothetical protein [Candidatus Paceibacterota bacterium]
MVPDVVLEREEVIFRNIADISAYYRSVFGKKINLDFEIFPNTNMNFFMAVHPHLEFPDVAAKIEKFFDVKFEQCFSTDLIMVDNRPKNLYVFSHSGSFEPELEKRNGGFVINPVEYLLATGFQKFVTGRFMDHEKWTVTDSTAPFNGTTRPVAFYTDPDQKVIRACYGAEECPEGGYREIVFKEK